MLYHHRGYRTDLERDAASLIEAMANLQAERAQAKSTGNQELLTVIERSIDAVEDDLACTIVAISDATDEMPCEIHRRLGAATPFWGMQPIDYRRLAAA